MTEPEKPKEKPYVRLLTKNTKKALVRRALKASPKAETAYVRDLKAILGGIHEGTMEALTPILNRWVPEKIAGEPRHDASARRPTGVSQVTERVIAGLRVHVARHVGQAFDRMADTVERANDHGMRLIGINARNVVPPNVLAEARDQNIQYMEDAGRAYAQQVREVFEDEENFGLTVDELVPLLTRRGEVSESRAELIARDQTLKLNGQITMARQQGAGINRYRWSTSLDERVRPMHADLEGTIQSWDDPPVTNPQGDQNHPGQDYQCRCTPTPLLDEEEV